MNSTAFRCLCDLCYVTKCPYVPPHPWNLDLPHTMLRAKAIKFKTGEVKAGEHISLQFEDEQTIRRQIQEMLHIEKIFDEEGIQSEIDAYAALVPDGVNWKATMPIEYPDEHERQRELARLIGVEDRMFVEVEGHPRVAAVADEDLDRENDEKTSAVHFVRFEFPPSARAAVRVGARVKLGCDRTNYPEHTPIAPDTLASLAGDLR